MFLFTEANTLDETPTYRRVFRYIWWR